MHEQVEDPVLNTTINLGLLQNLTFREGENGFVVALMDDEGYESVRGFGNNPTEAMNDLHRNLI